MQTATGEAQTRGKADRFYKNPVLRDQEWNRVRQLPWLVTVVAVAIIGIAFSVGVYGSEPDNAIGWVVGILAIAVYMVLGRQRRGWARRHLRQVHSQLAS